MAMRNEKSKTGEAFSASMPDEPMAATNGVDITETVLSVTCIRLAESFGVTESDLIALKGMMDEARSEQAGETSRAYALRFPGLDE